MARIELLLAYDDNTWTTKIVDCPNELNKSDLNEVEDWILDELLNPRRKSSEYDDVELMAVYDSEPG